MDNVNDQKHIPFALAQLRISSSPAFPAIVLDDAAVVPIDAILPLAARLGFALTEPDSLDGLLRNWDQNFQGLCAAVTALDDPKEGKYFRSAVSSIDFFTVDCPLTAPKQILSSDTLGGAGLLPRLASTLVGPNAKVVIPPKSDGLWGEVKLGIVISRPLHRATQAEANDAIAGFVSVSDYTDMTAWQSGEKLAAKQAPTTLAAGPYFLPAAFAEPQDKIDALLPCNGESSQGFKGGDIAPMTQTLSELSQSIQFFPGDLVCLGPTTSTNNLTLLGDGDIIEAAVTGLGRQTTNTIKES